MWHTSRPASELCCYAEVQGTRVGAPGHGAQPGGVASRAAGPRPSMGFCRVSAIFLFKNINKLLAYSGMYRPVYVYFSKLINKINNNCDMNVVH